MFLNHISTQQRLALDKMKTLLDGEEPSDLGGHKYRVSSPSNPSSLPGTIAMICNQIYYTIPRFHSTSPVFRLRSSLLFHHIVIRSSRTYTVGRWELGRHTPLRQCNQVPKVLATCLNLVHPRGPFDAWRGSHLFGDDDYHP